ncbi:MAG: hypothetical protein CVV44_21565 [Spirochaetae bacterium HGW-Spirochaetae-1]|jgi:hypothetical protein|nr:MAG: hypothetical protein CVV44_21565 [Spirochaetae bacterium HGW-Spirochaetae-1]
MDIQQSLDRIGKTVLASISYECYPVKEIDNVIDLIDTLLTDQDNLKQCEEYFKSVGSNYVLFYISNIIYNLKTKSELQLTPEVFKWLGSVWKNFLKRNKAYQEFLHSFDRYTKMLDKYYPGAGSFVNQIENVQLVKEHFIEDADPEYAEVKNLENFYNKSMEILNAMRPTYYFLIDYYYEKKMNTGEDNQDAAVLESLGLQGFGYSRYTYQNITMRACQSLGILEAVYLLLKKKKLSKQLTNVDGKLKLMSPAEIYDLYLKKFNEMKKEIVTLKK